jgi:hypothetical protein
VFIEKGDAFKGEGLFLRLKVTVKVNFRLGRGMRRTIGFLVALFGFFTFSFAQPIWGPDVQVSYNDEAALETQLAVTGEALHVVWGEWGSDSLGSYDDIFYIQSTDSGAHWSDTLRLSLRDNKGDVGPSIAAGVNDIHVVWNWFGGGMCYRRSTDGGLTWGSIDTALINGRPLHSAIFLQSDSLYLVSIDPFSKITKFRKSTNRGLTWLPVQDLGPGWQQPQVLVQRNLVHVFVEVLRPNAGEVFYTRSTDGGQTWASMWMMSSDDNRNSIFPCLTGRDTLNVYAVWMDRKYSPYDWTGDIFIRRSTDGGKTWAPEESLTVEHRAWDSDAIVQGDTLHVVWEDERTDPGRNNELFYRMSTDRGTTWGPEVRLTYAPQHSRYPSLGYGGKYLHLVWADGRRDPTFNESDVFHKRKVLFPSGIDVASPNGPVHGASVLRVFPNPARNMIFIHGIKEDVIAIYDVTGRLVRRIISLGSLRKEGVISWDCRDEKGKEVRSGVYFIRIGGNWQSQKVVVTR